MAPGSRYRFQSQPVTPADLTRLSLWCAEGDSNPHTVKY